MVREAGFEPAKPVGAVDLQSTDFGHSPIRAKIILGLAGLATGKVLRDGL